MDLGDRFWSKVDRREDACWLWTAGRSTGGYGKYGVTPQDIRYAHRLAYESLVGPIPKGTEIDHLCGVRLCVNPAHMECVSHRENILRSTAPPALNAAKTHCKRGHPFDETNTHVYRGGRWCRVCAAERARRYRKERSPP